MAEFEVERVGGELKRFGVEGAEVPFEVVSPYEPAGSQPKAIESLVQGVRDGDRYQVLLGVTGSGKTFTMAKTIEALGKPTLVMAPNKRSPLSLQASSKSSFPIMLWSTSSRITTTISPRRMCRKAIHISRKTPRLTKRSRCCAIRRPRHCSLDAM